ncbi:type VI secretion system amidase effector protein Tae4 [Thiohalocapsa sp. ML1]|jgi:hypothetical protein|uniref:type VI secretion system amidase effector protein Tae4 n=1 Tax=Thiohalocapsa sp. ML1 TaxID=1431688 RepID=UPI0009E7A69C|nr:type VI secretion system amidase effector protein Tae4 [Thiohalocapsa sp. ML1]
MSDDRPKLAEALAAFRAVYEDAGKTVSGVGTVIGGNVNHNINVVPVGRGRFENACAIRMSYVLNETGFKIPYTSRQTVSGAKGNWYFFRVTALISYLQQTFGGPDHTFSDPTPAMLSSHKGILVFEVDTWNDATGHATLWDGAVCSDQCYFPLSKKAYLWKLTD